MFFDDWFRSENKMRPIYTFLFIIMQLMVMSENNSFYLVNVRIQLSAIKLTHILFKRHIPALSAMPAPRCKAAGDGHPIFKWESHPGSLF